MHLAHRSTCMTSCSEKELPNANIVCLEKELPKAEGEREGGREGGREGREGGGREGGREGEDPFATNPPHSSLSFAGGRKMREERMERYLVKYLHSNITPLMTVTSIWSAKQKCTTYTHKRRV
jgi:hypothetical protein